MTGDVLAMSNADNASDHGNPANDHEQDGDYRQSSLRHPRAVECEKHENGTNGVHDEKSESKSADQWGDQDRHDRKEQHGEETVATEEDLSP